MVERLVFLGSATQVMLRLGPGVPLQALIQNDGGGAALAQGTPVHVYLATGRAAGAQRPGRRGAGRRRGRPARGHLTARGPPAAARPAQGG